jgi:membrane protein YdbS with pleckstrin-like domain
MKLSEEENRFLGYWEMNRGRRKRLIWKLAAGLPLAMVMVFSILINVYSGWFKGATSALRVNSTSVLVILAAIIGIVIFIVVFSSRHQWEMNEQRYRELMARKNNSA